MRASETKRRGGRAEKRERERERSRETRARERNREAKLSGGGNKRESPRLTIAYQSVHLTSEMRHGEASEIRRRRRARSLVETPRTSDADWPIAAPRARHLAPLAVSTRSLRTRRRISVAVGVSLSLSLALADSRVSLALVERLPLPPHRPRIRAPSHVLAADRCARRVRDDERTVFHFTSLALAESDAVAGRETAPNAFEQYPYSQKVVQLGRDAFFHCFVNHLPDT